MSSIIVLFCYTPAYEILISAQMHRTPLDLARQHGHGAVVELFKSKANKMVSDDCISELYMHIIICVMLYFV